LAGAIRSPEFYGKKEHATSAKARRNYILQAMVDRGWLTAKDGRAAMASKLGIVWTTKRGGIVNSRAPFFLEKVRQYLVARYGAEAVNLGGLRVRTTLDLGMQKQADDTVKRILDNPKDDPRAALVAIDPRTGAVRAMYGGRTFKTRQFNYATNAIRQAGSTMKPFVLAQALTDGISVNSVYPGPAELIVDGEDFKNYGDTNYGQMTLRDATRLSVNTIYVQLMQQVQPKRVAQFAKAHGLAAELGGQPEADKDPRPLEDPPVLKPVLALSLGSGDVTTLQLASAFGTWANRGIHQAPHLVEKVVDSRGRVLEEHRSPQGTQVIAPIHADTMNMVLRGAVENGTGNGARLYGREVAGKTGTTSDYADARFVGYTTDLVTSVWLGFEKPEKKLVGVRGLAGVSGGSLPAQIWHDYMDLATRDRPNQPFVPPADLGGLVLNPTTTAPPVTVPPTTQPGQNPPPTFPSPTQPGPSVPPTSLGQPGPGPDPTTPA
ncbi:MAG TPA: penicillin-binding transpeptidase domain-containing protein, partial [Actinomycetes bacterium]|nr:penicillin-binding transpeptidase domain-containing protein [Actinomycetes bacterium]